jgi:hypothetical protein
MLTLVSGRFGCTVGRPIMAAAAFQAAPLSRRLVMVAKAGFGRLKGGCGQDCPPRQTDPLLAIIRKRSFLDFGRTGVVDDTAQLEA